jgi:hypothetical protein
MKNSQTERQLDGKEFTHGTKLFSWCTYEARSYRKCHLIASKGVVTNTQVLADMWSFCVKPNLIWNTTHSRTVRTLRFGCAYTPYQTNERHMSVRRVYRVVRLNISATTSPNSADQNLLFWLI